jgi:hypothetical protein
MEVKKFLILTILLFVFVTSAAAVCVEIKGKPEAKIPVVLFAAYPYYWAEWGYWAYQYPNAFPTYGFLNDTRKTVWQGKLLNDGKPMKGKVLGKTL